MRPNQPVLSADEVRRRRREAVLIGISALAFAVFAVLQTRLPELSERSSQSSNVVFFLLINLNVILLVLLIFLVTRNLVKLIVERQHRILGARLRTRLVVAFACLSLVPTILLFIIAEGFLGAAIDNWFSLRMQSAFSGSLQVAQRYYQARGDDALYFAGELAREVEQRDLLDAGRREQLMRLVESRRTALKLDGVEVVTGGGTVAVSRTPELVQRGLKVRPVDLRAAFDDGQEFARTERLGRGDVISGGVPIRGRDGAVAGVVVVRYFVPHAISTAARRTVRAAEEYQRLQVLKQPIRNSYTLTFFLVTLVVLLSATWFGFAFAKGITVPIQRLGEGMREVAQGNLDYRAELGGDEEIATLVTSFNRMTEDLKTSHAELEARHRSIESILANITAGVVSVDEDGSVATVNPAAASMLGLRPEAARGQPWREVFRRPDLQSIGDLVERLDAGRRERLDQQVTLSGGPRPLTAWVTATALSDEQGVPHGFILFVEDVSFLLRVERMEAWREVARRIAHEIKNPLTPIQLSAQRLHKRYAGRLAEDDGALLDECTRTIIGQVEQLKTLVNEFSTFARLPAVEVAPHDLRAVVDEALVLYREGHRDIRFDLRADAEVPLIDIDPDAVKRAVINLLDNAVAACRDAEGGGHIVVTVAHDLAMSVVRLEVADNGSGMTPGIRARAFEPYFSTKNDGTGLGLAIVAAIVADHHAYVRVHDNVPHGVRVVIEFPLRRAGRLQAVAGG